MPGVHLCDGAVAICAGASLWVLRCERYVVATLNISVFNTKPSPYKKKKISQLTTPKQTTTRIDRSRCRCVLLRMLLVMLLLLLPVRGGGLSSSSSSGRCRCGCRRDRCRSLGGRALAAVLLLLLDRGCLSGSSSRCSSGRSSSSSRSSRRGLHFLRRGSRLRCSGRRRGCCGCGCCVCLLALLLAGSSGAAAAAGAGAGAAAAAGAGFDAGADEAAAAAVVFCSTFGLSLALLQNSLLSLVGKLFCKMWNLVICLTLRWPMFPGTVPSVTRKI